MEHKSWLWKKTSTEKTMITSEKINKGDEDEANSTDIMELQRNLKISEEKLSAALAEINAKDDIAKKQTNIAREAIQGWEKAETEVLELKQEQEKRVHDLEEKLAESNKLISKLGLENTQLSKNLSAKEKIIDELHSIRAQVEYDLRAVVSQLESMQRENASLTYEVRVLEKELEIRNEEREFNRRTSEVAHKQYLGSIKKIAKLETEAQRLRILVQKRLPGPADVAKMKMLKETDEVTRRKSNPFPVASKDHFNHTIDDASSIKITFLTEQLCSFEEENRLLKEFLKQKTIDLSKSQTSEMGSDEKVSMAESWAPSFGASDIGLMDDFVEMERLASEKEKTLGDDVTELGNSGMTKSIKRLIEIIQEIKLSKKDEDDDGLGLSQYTVHIFQWKTSEIRGILDGFLEICNNLINGKVGLEDFYQGLTFALEWIVNHCFSLQDVSSMKDEIKKQVEESGTHLLETENFSFPKDQLPGWPMGNVKSNIFHLEDVGKFKDDVANVESVNKDLEEGSNSKCESLVITGVESSNEQEGNLEEQIEVDIMVNDLEKDRGETVDECSEAHQEHVSTEGNEDNNGSYEKSITENDVENCNLDPNENTLPSEKEITKASEKLAECQETILNLGKQLKALGSSPPITIDTSISDKCEITKLPSPNGNHRISLLDKMITEDATGALRSQKSKGENGNLNLVVMSSPKMFVSVDGVKDEKDEEDLVNFLSIVTNKKKKNGGGFLRRLFGRKKKEDRR